MRIRSSLIVLGAVVAGGIGLVVFQAERATLPMSVAEAREAASPLSLKDIPFDGQQAYEYLKAICALGPRVSGSTGMQAQQKMLLEHFEKLGAKVSLQRFRARHPLDGSLVPMANLVVQWHPERKERVLFAAHYDTRPYPDRDPDPVQRQRGRFLGANDGGSGVALLMELGRTMPQLDSKLGVDFVLFDGEELIFDDERDPYFLGSEWFARQYAASPPPYRYRWGVLLDMIGDADLQLFQEKNSMSWKDTQPLVLELWATAARLGVKEFIPRRKHEIRDDHLKLHSIAKIPTCDIIDFDYPYWHTTEDSAEKCSALSLAKVGWVLDEWLKTAKP